MSASTNTSRATLFTIVSSYQVHENYGHRWKAKGGNEVVCSPILNLEQLMLLSADEKQALVDRARPQDNDMFEYSNEHWEIVTLDADLIERVRAHIADEYDLGFARYTFDGTDFEFDWSCRQDSSLLASVDPDCAMNKWEIERISRIAA